jgi:hypothetical protein
VYLPHPQYAPWVVQFIDECAAFPNGTHDDDCFVAGTKITTLFGDKNIEDIRKGEWLITPFGLRKVIASKTTGLKPVIDRLGFTATPSHLVFTLDSGFARLDSLTQAPNCDILSLGGALKWKYRKLLCSMESNTASWGRESIISASRQTMKGGKIQKDFMLRFGNFITAGQFRKVMTFTTKTATILITTSATWSVYRIANIARRGGFLIKNCKRNILTALENWLRFGTEPKKGMNGINGIGNVVLAKSRQSHTRVSFAGNTINPSIMPPAFAPTIATLNGDIGAKNSHSQPNVLFAEQSLRLPEPIGIQMEQKPVAEDARANSTGRIERTYNLTVDKDHVYYAHGLLVSNCDAMSQALNRLIHRGRTKDPALRPKYENTPEALEARHLAKIEREHRFGKKPVYL